MMLKDWKKKTKKMNSNRKGKNGEREMAEFITRITGVKYRRVPMSGAIHEYNPWDLMKTDKKSSVLDGVGIEVKNSEILHPKDWIDQCEVSSSDADQIIPRWVLCFKYKHKWYFTVPQPYL